jgi:hypothetical protein
MSLSANKIIVSGIGSNATAGFFQTTTVSATSSGVVIPAGMYQLVASSANNSNVVVQINTTVDGNVSNGTWTNIASVNTSTFFLSDGVSVRALSSNAAATMVLLTPNGGQSVTQSAFATS